jgi:hypothetical protein
VLFECPCPNSPLQPISHFNKCHPSLYSPDVMRQDCRCLLYESKRNGESAPYIKEIAADCMLRREPRITFDALMKREENVSLKNKIVEKVRVIKTTTRYNQNIACRTLVHVSKRLFVPMCVCFCVSVNMPDVEPLVVGAIRSYSWTTMCPWTASRRQPTRQRRFTSRASS